MRNSYSDTLPTSPIIYNMLSVLLLSNNVQIKVLAVGQDSDAGVRWSGLSVHCSRENIILQKQLNLAELLPKGMNYEGIYVCPIYGHVYSQFMADRTKSRKATLKPLKTLCFIAPPQQRTLTVGPQTTPRGPPLQPSLHS